MIYISVENTCGTGNPNIYGNAAYFTTVCSVLRMANPEEEEPNGVKNTGFVVYPNPVAQNQALEIFLTEIISTEGSIELYDIMGQLLVSTKLIPNTLKQSLVLPPNLPTGTYFIKITAGEHHWTQKLLAE